MSATNASIPWLPVCLAMASAAATVRFGSRPLMPTRAPIEARAMAAALPIPLVPPVTRTVLPDIGWLSLIVCPSGIERCPTSSTEDIGRGRWIFDGPSCGSGGHLRSPGRRRGRSIRSGDDVRDHREEPEVEDPQQEQDKEPSLALELGRVQKGADPREEAADHRTDDRQATGDAESEQRQGERTSLDTNDIRAVHDEQSVRLRQPDRDDQEDGPRACRDDAADEES